VRWVTDWERLTGSAMGRVRFPVKFSRGFVISGFFMPARQAKAGSAEVEQVLDGRLAARQFSSNQDRLCECGLSRKPFLPIPGLMQADREPPIILGLSGPLYGVRNVLKPIWRVV
jgi:hypothetical protein